MNLFYSPNIVEPVTVLSTEESKHIIRVLRKKKGDIVFFTNGKGHNFKCIITDDNSKKCEIEIIEKTNGNDHRDFYLHIAIAPTKNITRFEWFLEKATEIGIDEITPIICFHSERKEIKIERLNKVITSAMKQSLKSFHPVLNNKTKLSELISRASNKHKFIAYIHDDVTLELSKVYKPKQDALILIGPEGDFSPEEVELAINHGFVPVSLGSSRLRTETAGIIACHTVGLINDMSV